MGYAYYLQNPGVVYTRVSTVPAKIANPEITKNRIYGDARVFELIVRSALDHEMRVATALTIFTRARGAGLKMSRFLYASFLTKMLYKACTDKFEK